MKYKNIKQICPECNNELIIKDFDLFMERLRDSWAIASMGFNFEDLPEEQKEQIRKQNREEYISEHLKKGYVRFVCNPCSAILFWEGVKKEQERKNEK